MNKKAVRIERNRNSCHYDIDTDCNPMWDEHVFLDPDEINDMCYIFRRYNELMSKLENLKDNQKGPHCG